MKPFVYHAKDGQMVRIRGLFLAAIAILALSALSSCMLVPNGATRVDKNTPVQFVGGVMASNVPITIEAYDPQGKKWDNIGTITSTNYKLIGYGSDYAYLWAGWLQIPNQYWAENQQCATEGESARVRAKWDKELPTVRGDVASCYMQHPGDAFFSYCTTSGGVYVGALDYRDFGKECADLINRIRNIEGKSPLKINEAGECDADSDAKCDYEWELKNDGAHHCTHGNGWNECTYKDTEPTIDDVLGGCLWQRMYKNEKQCYIDTNGSCQNCKCGHYLNMISGAFTEVSCGLYKTPDGKFKAVQNFYQ